MSLLKTVFAEIVHRKGTFLLSLSAVVVGAALFVASPTLLSGYQRQSSEELAAFEQESHVKLKKMEDDVRKLMLKLGFNLRIVHRDTDMSQLYGSFVAKDMPEEYVERLATSPLFTKVTHLVPALHSLVTWEDRKRLISGFASEVQKSHEGVKKPMGYMIERGSVFLGHEAGIGHKVNEQVEILGATFRVAKILPERGTTDDIMIAMNLKDAQGVLNKPGKVTEILALNCKCKTVDRLGEIRQQLEAVLPEAKVLELNSQAVVRAEQREMAERVHKEQLASIQSRQAKEEANLQTLWRILTPLSIAFAAIWVGLFSAENVRQRRVEIGLLRALGKRSLHIAALFLTKSALLGLVGGAVGALLGYAVARLLGQQAMDLAPEFLALPKREFLLALCGMPLLAMMSAYLPTLVAISKDPAEALRES